jgi:HEAT repeat protein
LEAMHDRLPQVRADAVRSYAHVARACSEPAGPLMAAAENDVDVKVRIAALRAVADDWPGEPFLYPKLFLRLKTVSSQEEKSAIAWILGSLDPPPLETIPALIEALSTNDLALRRSIPVALGKLGAAGRPALPALAQAARIELAGQQSTYAAIAAIAAIARDSSEAQALIEPLTALLRGSQSAIQRQQAMFLLARFGPSAAPAIAALRDALKSENPELRQRASYVLASIGAAAQSAIPDLETLARDDPSHSVRQSAETAAKRLRQDVSLAASSK